MDARDKKQIIAWSEAAGALALHAVADHVGQTMEKAYLLGFEAGKLEGIEEGRQSAAGLIAGLRQLLGQLEGGAIPAPFQPMSAGYAGGRIGCRTTPVIAEDRGAEFDLNTKTGEIKTDPAELAAELGLNEAGASLADNLAAARENSQLPAEYRETLEKSEKLLEAHPGINFPGYFPLDVPVGDCSICQGLGTVAGELYGAPCLVPCICEAGQRVEVVAGLKVDETGELADAVIAGALAPQDDDQVEEFPEVKDPVAADAFEEFATAIEEGERAAAEPQVVDQVEEEREEVICFRLNCKNHSPAEANGCATIEHIFECPHLLGPDAVVCANLGCSSFVSGKPANCAAIADMMLTEKVRKPATSCNAFQPAPDLAGIATFDPDQIVDQEGQEDGERYVCCSTCNLKSPDCQSCNLIEAEIEERNEAERIAKAAGCKHHHRQVNPKDMSEYCRDCGTVTKPGKAAEVPKCGNGSCTATGREAKEVCLLIQGKECKNFVPAAECGHRPEKRFTAEDGSLMCGVCGTMVQASRKAAAGASSPEPKGEAQAEELTPDQQRMKALQDNCKHPKPFIKVIPGRGEVCEVCDLVLTPESLPLPGIGDQVKEAPDASTYFTAGEELEEELGDECDHLPLDVQYVEDGKTICGLCGKEVPQEEGPAPAVVECEHPADCRRPEPIMENGQKVGSLIRCGECNQVIARFDNERKPIPRELWPETGGKLDAAAIRKHGYRPAELKMIKAGFSLIRYDRDDKNLYRTCKDPALGRFLVLHGKTYADCERRLAEELKDPKLVQVDSSGNAADRHAEAKLRAAGFEFYRFEKSSPGVSPKIKVGSKNWGMLAKYKDDAELEAAWKKLLTEDPLALEG